MLGLASCASLVNPSTSEVQIRTRPDHAHCDLSGHDGFSLAIDTPATVTLPRSAAPVTVACQAPGFRRTVNTLDATANGWLWGNSAFMLATSGAGALGLLVDETLGAGRTFRKEAEIDLDPDRKRTLRAIQRNGGQELDLQTR